MKTFINHYKFQCIFIVIWTIMMRFSWNFVKNDGFYRKKPEKWCKIVKKYQNPVKIDHFMPFVIVCLRKRLNTFIPERIQSFALRTEPLILRHWSWVPRRASQGSSTNTCMAAGKSDTPCRVSRRVLSTHLEIRLKRTAHASGAPRDPCAVRV